MAIATGPLILGGVAIALLLGAVASGGSTKPAEGKREPQGPIPTPQTADDIRLVDQTICQCFAELEGFEQVQDLPTTLQLCVAATLHPDVAWPPQEGDDPTVAAAFQIFLSRVQAFVAAPDKAGFCEGTEPGATPTEIIEDWYTSKPTPGKLYTIGTDGETSMSAIARKALDSVIPGTGNNGALRLEYIHCISSGPRYNMPLYASGSFSSTYPTMYGVNGKGLRTAFFPWHEDVKAAIFDGRFPKPAQTGAGARVPGVGSKFGTLWLPPVDPDALAQGVVTCGHRPWSDGSSSIDPPPEILSMLKGAP